MLTEPEVPYEADETVLPNEDAAKAHANRYADYAELDTTSRKDAIDAAAAWFHAGALAAPETLTYGALWGMLSRRFGHRGLRGRARLGGAA